MFKIYSKEGCPSCDSAKHLLTNKDVEYEEHDVFADEEATEFFLDKKFRTVPQIYHNDWHIGGYEDLLAYVEAE